METEITQGGDTLQHPPALGTFGAQMTGGLEHILGIFASCFYYSLDDSRR